MSDTKIKMIRAQAPTLTIQKHHICSLWNRNCTKCSNHVAVRPRPKVTRKVRKVRQVRQVKVDDHSICKLWGNICNVCRAIKKD